MKKEKIISCHDCGHCLSFCPVNAIERRVEEEGSAAGFRYEIDEERCINCSVCTSMCPTGSWFAARSGYSVLIGGTMGKIPRFASVLKPLVETEEEVLALVESAIAFYCEHGRKKERFGHMIDRIGLDIVREEILEGALQRVEK